MNNNDNNEQKHNVELIVRQEEKEDNINLMEEFTKIFSRLKTKKKSFLKIIVLFLAVGLIAGLCTPFFADSSQEVRSVIAFSYDGIDNGLAPDGTPLNVNKIKSSDIIEKALESLSITDISPDEVKRHIAINGVTPSNIIDRINVLNEMSKSKPETLMEIIELEYTPTQYIISFDIDNMKISPEKAVSILNAVTEEYRQYFHDKYFDENMLSASVNVLDYSKYDYSDSLNIMETQLYTISEYIETMKKTTKNFRSADTGYSYSDIAKAISVIQDVDVAKLYSIIYSYNLTQDRNSLITYYTYLKEEAERNLNEAVENKQSIQSSIDSYQKDPIVITGNSEQSEQISSLAVSGEIYDRLIEQNIQAAARISSISNKISKLQSRIDMINAAVYSDSNFTQEEYEAKKSEVETSIADVNAQIGKYIDIIKAITEEYYETKHYDDAYRVSVPASYKNERGTNAVLNAVKYAAAGAVGGFLLMLIYQTAAVYIPFDIFFEKKNNKNKKK